MIKQATTVVTQLAKLPWKSISQMTAIVTLISASLGLYWQINAKLTETIKEQTQVIIQEMDERTTWIAEFEKEDLFERIQVLELQIAAIEQSGEPVPERLLFHLGSMRERYMELKETWKDR